MTTTEICSTLTDILADPGISANTKNLSESNLSPNHDVVLKGEFVRYDPEIIQSDQDAEMAVSSCNHSHLHEPTDSSSDPNLDEPVDPRVEQRIITLSDTATTLNRLQSHLRFFELRSAEIQTTVADNIERFGQELGSCVIESAPYYLALDEMRKSEHELQQASFAYARAQARLKFSREKIESLEGDLMRAGGTEDIATLLLLNTANADYEYLRQEVVQASNDHENASRQHIILLQKIAKMKATLKAIIEDAKPYYDLKHRMQCVVTEDRLTVVHLEKTIDHTKELRENEVKELELISQEIHAHRLLSLSKS